MQLLGRAAGGGGREAGRDGPALGVVGAVRGAGGLSDVLDWQDLPALRVDATDPPVRLAANVSVDDPTQRLAALEQAPEASRPRCCWPGPRAALEAGGTRPCDEVVSQMLAEDPWEWRAVWMSGLVALRAGRRPTRSARSTPSTGRCRASSLPSWRWRSPARTAARPTSPSRSTSPAPAPTPTTSRRPPSVWPGSARDAGTWTARSQALDLVPSTSRNYPESQRQKAELLYAAGRRAADAGAGDGQHRAGPDGSGGASPS